VAPQAELDGMKHFNKYVTLKNIIDQNFAFHKAIKKKKMQ